MSMLEEARFDKIELSSIGPSACATRTRTRCGSNAFESCNSVLKIDISTEKYLNNAINWNEKGSLNSATTEKMKRFHQ